MDRGWASSQVLRLRVCVCVRKRKIIEGRKFSPLLCLKNIVHESETLQSHANAAHAQAQACRRGWVQMMAKDAGIGLHEFTLRFMV